MYVNNEEPKTIQECLEWLKKGCKLLTDECNYPKNYSAFNSPATEEELKDFESYLKFPLPYAYREFLKFSNGARIMGQDIYGLDMFGTNDDFVPDGYLAIGSTEVTTERLAISEDDGEIYSFWDLNGSITDFEHEMFSLLELCDDKIQEYKDEKEREERRKAGITQEQELQELYAQIKAERKRIDEEKKLKMRK